MFHFIEALFELVGSLLIGLFGGWNEMDIHLLYLASQRRDEEDWEDED